ncbi:MAG: class I SAM-dependent methyltransferase [Candidatus Altiarchaeota archaeon]|nr:class I SAM-dependent methyltransferase [Candidatus Altiarchaeota archaeon]
MPKLNIGCGRDLLDGYTNADVCPVEGAEYANVMDLPYPKNHFDEVLCYSVLEHVEDPFKAVSELYRVLKKGGIVKGSTPLYHPYHSKHDYWRFTHQGLELMFKEFSKIKITRLDGNFAVMGIFSGPILRPVFEKLDKIKKVGNRSTTTLLFELVK